MKKQLIILLSGIALMFGLGLTAPVTAGAVEANPQVCSGLDSGKIDVSGDRKTLVVHAPSGSLIVGYCVKAGSVKNGYGPRYIDLAEPQATLTLSYPGGKAISHYSLDFDTAPQDACPNVPGHQAPGTNCGEGNDACPDMPGHQPPGTECEEDACPDMDGHQPPGTECEEEDACPDMDGHQPPGTECEEDACPLVPGHQEPGTNCGEPLPCDEVCPVPVMGTGTDLRCNGSYIGGTYTNVTVPRGATCILQDAYVNGDVTTEGARNVYVLDTTVVGDLRLTGVTGDVRFGNKAGCGVDPAVGGSIVVKASHNVLVCQATVCESVKVIGSDGMVTIRDSNIADQLVIRNTKKYAGPSAQEVGHRKPGAIRVLRVKAGSAIKLIDNHPRRQLIVRDSLPTPTIS